MDRWATFDCYGTLIDWNGGIRAELRRVFGDPLAERIASEHVDDPDPDPEPDAGADAAADAGMPPEPKADPREVELEAELDDILRRYHTLEREIEKNGSLSYREVMTEAMQQLGASESEKGGLAASLPTWQPFPETRDALTELRARGWKLAILSNSDLDLIEASKSLIGVPFEETVVASQIRSYKPALMHWMEFYGRTLANRRRHVHVGASSYHDIAPAAKLRIPNVWINRLGEHAETSPTRELPDLTELPDTVDELMPA
ncbi:MAG TPA: HAD family hydrolase [Gaiellaceae bacterium]|jgi:2-haloacid dehalogenase|nr:HAD family hydrolase [Gaiellaceae bacterium]